jgi:hypothetical protein
MQNVVGGSAILAIREIEDATNSFSFKDQNQVQLDFTLAPVPANATTTMVPGGTLGQNIFPFYGYADSIIIGVYRGAAPAGSATIKFKISGIEVAALTTSLPDAAAVYAIGRVNKEFRGLMAYGYCRKMADTFRVDVTTSADWFATNTALRASVLMKPWEY